MQPDLKIAIVIPSYNGAATINEALQSLMAQSALGAVDKVYLADDASQDRTIEYAKACWTVSTPFEILAYQTNLGIFGNKNRAMSVLKNSGVDWLLYLHQDDIAKPGWLDLTLARIKACSETVASICSSWDDLIMPDHITKPGEDKENSQPVEITGSADNVRGTLYKGCWWHISGAAIRLKALEVTGLFEPQFVQTADLEWILRALSLGWSFEYIPRTLIVWRQHEKAQSSRSLYSDFDLKEGMLLRQKYARYLSKSDVRKLQFRTASSAARRIARSILRRDIRKFAISTNTLFLALRKGLTV